MSAEIKTVKNKNGTTSYRVSIYLGIDELTGKKRRTTRCYPTKKEAERAIVTVKAEYERNKHRTNQKIRFTEAYEMWLENYQIDVKESTLNKTMERFRLHILPVFGECLIDKVNVRFCQKAVATWRESLVHYKRIFNYASSVFDYMVSLEAITDNPCNRVFIPKPKPQTIELNAEEDFWTRDEVDMFFNQLKKEENPMYYPLFRVAILTGVRRGELISLRWDCIDFDKQTISILRTATVGLNNKLIVQTPKTKNSFREITVDNETIEILKAWKTTQAATLSKLGYNPTSKEQLVFPNKKNTMLSLSKVGQIMKRIVDKCEGLKKIKVHGMRHTCCSLLFESGANLNQVKSILGHRDSKTTLNVYTHVTKKEQEKTTQIYADYLSN